MHQSLFIPEHFMSQEGHINLHRKEATIEEIADLVKRNNNIKYYNQIKIWNNGFEEEKGV